MALLDRGRPVNKIAGTTILAIVDPSVVRGTGGGRGLPQEQAPTFGVA